MNKLKKGEYMDFNYKGRWLSEFGGYVGSTDGGFRTFSLLPSRSYVTEKPLGSNKTIVFVSSLDPRTIVIPIVFEDMTEIGLRDVAAWLDSPEPSPLYFKGEDIAIDCVLDAQAFDIETIGGIDGLVEIKFIANDPIFYSMKENKTILTNVKTTQKYTIKNPSTYEVFPTIEVSCNGKLTIVIYDKNDKICSTSVITDITSGVIIDCLNLDCTTLSGAPWFDKIDTFPTLPVGDFKIMFAGDNITNAVITFKEQYI